MRKVVRRLLVASLACGALVAMVAWGVYRASRQAPEFYRQALTASGATLHEQGQRFEQQALTLHNQAYHAGRWEVRFAQDEINGWLAVELPANFPRILPTGVSEPRIDINRGVVRMAVHYQRGNVDTVISLTGDAYLTEHPNEVAIRIEQARAGLVPVPLAKFLQEITERAARADIPLRWTEVRGAPVAIVRLPLESKEADHRQVVLERLTFSDGELLVAGRTDELSPGSRERIAPVTATQPADSDTRQR
jgi:hypothetical protein